MRWHIFVHVFEHLVDGWELLCRSRLKCIPDLFQCFLSDTFLEICIDDLLINEEGLESLDRVANRIQIILPLGHFLLIPVG